MSLSIYPVFESKLTGIEFDALGEILAANFEMLDKIADSANLVRFTAFGDNRPIPDDFVGDPDELAESMGEWTEWFDPEAGKAAFLSLAYYIKVTPKAAKLLTEPTGVVLELEEMTRVLDVAVSENVRFRLQMS